MKLKSILYFLSTILFASCSSKYVKTDNKWTWVSYNEGGKEVREMEADMSSFRILKHKEYAMDKDKIYIRGQELKHADLSSFEVLSKNNYSKDKTFVFLNQHIIISADPVSFEILEWPYAKDSKTIFCGNIPMKVSDNTEFEVTKSDGVSASYYPLPMFIKLNEEYQWLDSIEIPINGIVVGEQSEGKTSTEKFKGFKKIE